LIYRPFGFHFRNRYVRLAIFINNKSRSIKPRHAERDARMKTVKFPRSRRRFAVKLKNRANRSTFASPRDNRERYID